MPILDPDFQHRDHYISAFGMMFWAFLFFIDFHVNLNGLSISLLPIVVGYILIFIASKSLFTLHGSAVQIRTISGVLIPFGLLEFIRFPSHQITVSSSSGIPMNLITPLIPIAIVGTLLSILELVLKTMLVWKICGLVADLGSSVFNERLQSAALFRRGFYVFLVFAPFVAMLLAAVLMPLGFLLFLVLFVAYLICIGLLMGLMRQAQDTCKRM